MVRRVFYSFHYQNDARRVQQIINIGAIEGSQVAHPNKWEEIKRSGHGAICRWIDKSMEGRSCVIVLVGSNTWERRYVQYEIKKAWEDRKGLLGIFIHNIKCPQNGTCQKGANPFQHIHLNDFSPLSRYIECHDPGANDAYNVIRSNLPAWIDRAIKEAQVRPNLTIMD